MAIKALEEVQQLHEVGTVEEFRRLKEQAKTSEDEMVAELMKLRDRQLHGECYRDMEEQSCTLEVACRDCYEEKVREILQIERKE